MASSIAIEHQWFYLTTVICWYTVKKFNSYNWPIDVILTGTTTPSRGGPRGNDNEGVLHIPQSSRTGSSLSETV